MVPVIIEKEKPKSRVQSIIESIDFILNEIPNLPDLGLLAHTIKRESVQYLSQSRDMMTNILILDKLL